MYDEILTNLSPEALALAVEENEIASRCYRARIAAWELVEQPGLTIYRSGLAHDPFWNGVLRTDFMLEEADARIAATLADFQTRGLPFTWWLGPSRYPADLKDRLSAAGLTPGSDDPGMAADLARLNDDLPAPSGLAIERIGDDTGARRWLATFRAGNELDTDDVSTVPLSHFAPGGYHDDEPLQFYLATLDGVPVATAQILYAAGAAGVYCVATVPFARRRGIGAAVTLAGLRAARERGYRAAVLGSTAMGFPVYARLGFRQYCTLSLCEWSPSSV